MIAKANHKCSTSPLFAKMGLLKFHDIVLKDTAIAMYKVANLEAPMRIVSMFKNFSTTHQHETRQHSDSDDHYNGGPVSLDPQ